MRYEECPSVWNSSIQVPLSHLSHTLAHYLDLSMLSPGAKVLLQIKQGYLATTWWSNDFHKAKHLDLREKCLLHFKPVQGSIITYGNSQKYGATGKKYCGISITIMLNLRRYWHNKCYYISVLLLSWWHWAQPEQNYWSIYLSSLVDLQSILSFIPSWQSCQHVM